jgi:hypothetical protein
MLKKITTAVALSATLFVATTLPTMAHEGEVHCEDTVLSGIMKEMNDDLKSYVAAFKRNDPAAMQAQVTKLLANTAKAKNEVPVKLKQKQNDMPVMDHDMSAMDKNMPAMDHDMSAMDQNMPAMNHDMPAIDHSQMENMPGMDHQTHMQHQGYQQGIEKLTHLFKQLQTASTKTEVKTVLNTIKQHTKKSHREYQLDCE